MTCGAAQKTTLYARKLQRPKKTTTKRNKNTIRIFLGRPVQTTKKNASLELINCFFT
jgi:hypothetical protein